LIGFANQRRRGFAMIKLTKENFKTRDALSNYYLLESNYYYYRQAT
jgi:hypothetical protein